MVCKYVIKFNRLSTQFDHVCVSDVDVDDVYGVISSWCRMGPKAERKTTKLGIVTLQDKIIIM